MDVPCAGGIGESETGRVERLGDTIMTPPTEENKALVRRHIEAINHQDWEACADTIAEDIVFHQRGETHHGVEWFVNHLKGFYDTFPDASITINEVLADGDRVAARITTSGTNDAEIPSIDSTGTEIEFSSHLVARIEDESLAELWVVAEHPRPASQ